MVVQVFCRPGAQLLPPLRRVAVRPQWEQVARKIEGSLHLVEEIIVPPGSRVGLEHDLHDGLLQQVSLQPHLRTLRCSVQCGKKLGEQRIVHVHDGVKVNWNYQFGSDMLQASGVSAAVVDDPSGGEVPATLCAGPDMLVELLLVLPGVKVSGLGNLQVLLVGLRSRAATVAAIPEHAVAVTSNVNLSWQNYILIWYASYFMDTYINSSIKGNHH